MKQSIISIQAHSKKHPFQQQSQFEQFKDQQFTKHKKFQFHPKKTRQKSINSLSVYTLACMTQQNVIRPAEIKLTETNGNKLYKLQANQESNALKSLDIKQYKKFKQFKLTRYSRNQDKFRPEKQLTLQQNNLLKNEQNIGLLKKIIDHYNSKSTQKAYYSNLINNSGAKPNTSSSHDKSVIVKKMVPKNACRRDVHTSTNQDMLKIRQKLNMHGFDVYEDYFNHSKIILEAQSMNQIIKQFIEQKKKLCSSTNHHSMNKMKQTSYSCSGNKPCLPFNSRVRKTAASKHQNRPQSKSKMMESMSDNSINQKVNKFRQFLFMINLSNGIYRELDIQRYQTNLKIYIGKGNNCNLIKSLMKKRFWFELTKIKEEAHFVWTQLKEEFIYNKQVEVSLDRLQQRQVKYLESHIVNNEDKKQECIESTNHTMTEETDLITNLRENQEINVKCKTQIKSAKPRSRATESSAAHLKIMTKTQNKIYNQMINELIYRRKIKFSERVRYLKGIKEVQQLQLNSQTIHNHLPLNGLLGNKKAMFYMLREYYKLTNQHIFNIVPLTFHIKSGFLDSQFKEFMEKFMENKRISLPNYWIIKPGQFSNRGQGITCTNKLQEIRSRIGNLRKQGKRKSLILQQYITNPLLYNNRKFDIRTYMLISINNGKLRGYWYQDGYVRTSSYVWNLTEISDTFIHLTNDAIQKYSSDYGKYQPGNKLTYSQLQRYFDSIPKNGKNYNFQEQIYPKFKQIAINAIKSSFYFIDPHRKGNNFQIFGFDFMIDTNFKPWLIEINTNPCLQMNCPVLERIIPSMVQNAFRIAVDPIFPPPTNFSSTYKYSIPQNALHYNKFELIFDEQRDGTQLIDLYKNSRVVDLIDEYEEDKQIYQEQGQQLCLQEP